MNKIRRQARTAARTHPRSAATAGFLIGMLACLLFAAPAQAEFGFSEFDVTFTNENGSTAVQAGSHPFAMKTALHFISSPTGEGGEVTEEAVKDISVAQLPGFAGNPTVAPQCATAQFLSRSQNLDGGSQPDCPDAAAIGLVQVTLSSKSGSAPLYSTVYNLEPPPGVAAKIGFWTAEVPIPVELGVRETPPYNVIGGPTNVSQVLEVLGSELTLWGVPADPAHDELRGRCLAGAPIDPKVSTEPHSLGSCPANVTPRPFLTLPRACAGPLKTEYEIDSWQNPGLFVNGFAETHDSGGQPLGMSGCGKVGFGPEITAKPTTRATESASGLDFSLDVNDEGLANPSYEAVADSDVEKAVVTLPEGMTVNPSSATGLEVCSEEDLRRETLAAAPGEGCPEASKLGTLEVETPLLEETVRGSLFLAKPYENPEHSLLALYIVLKSQSRGILIKLPAKVEADPRTGQLVTTSEGLPQIPFSHFRLHFREGARSPLVSPPACGEYSTEAKLTPWSGGAPVLATSSFKIVSGADESPCPTGGTPPFKPGFEAGTNNNDAGSYSPFYMRLTRRDGDQDLTKFSAKLPPGMVAKLAGTTQCSDAAIAQARGRTGPHGGAEELASPSCPASSEIGHVLAGAGVGAVLTYVPGKVYLAGPYRGAPLSVVAIVPAVAGPFDVGTVVTRQALQVDPRTAEVTADGSASDPIPHILAGIPLKVRDVRVYVDRPSFTLNPTSCDPFAVGATLWAGGKDVFSSADDTPQQASARFQAANCTNLGFKPRLSLALKGGAKRGGHPALTGTYTPRGGDANLAGLVLRLPRSAFLDQAHIRTICTRVQFAANGGNGAGCPAAAVYGHATAYTPILDQPLSGPVYLRSSSHNLPDFVAALHGLVDFEAVARIDSKGGGIRATFSNLPDAPLTKVVVQMQGARKGLIVNSTNLCAARHRAGARFSGQNGKRFSAKPVVQADCGKGRGHKKRNRHSR